MESLVFVFLQNDIELPNCDLTVTKHAYYS